MRPLQHRLAGAIRRLPGLKLCAAGVALGWAAPAAWAQVIGVVPSLTITETITDNRDLVTSDRHGDLVTQISPGLAISAKRGAVQGSLLYSLNGLVFARDSAQNSVFHSLASSGKLSLLDGRVGVDVAANAGRQVTSAYGTQSVGVAQLGGNQAQVFSYNVAPYLTGRMPGNTTYQVRMAIASSTSDAANGSGNSASLDASAGLAGRIGSLGWSADVNRLFSEISDRPRTHSGRVTGSLNYSPDIEVQVALRAGTEVNDIRTGSSERTSTWGAGLTWTPGPRTSLRMDLDDRFFGRSHAFSLSHRMARTVVTFTDSRSLDSSGISSRGALSNYDFFMQQFSSITDPALRDTVVRNLLASRNLDPAGRELAAGFLTNGPTVQRTQNLAITYQGLRTTLTGLAFQTWTRNASRSQAASGDLAGGQPVKQQGLNVSLTYRLTSDASIIVSGSQQKTPGAGQRSGNDLQSISATWSAKLGLHSNVSLGIRHTIFDSEVNPYHESAVIGSIRMQF